MRYAIIGIAQSTFVSDAGTIKPKVVKNQLAKITTVPQMLSRKLCRNSILNHC